MIKVTIENKGSASLSIKGRHGFHIGPHSTVTVELPDTPATANMVQRVRREYPAMRVSIEKPSAQPPAAGKEGTATTPSDTSNAAQTPPTSPSGTPTGGAGAGGKMTEEDFKARAKVTAGESGWWTVAVEGLQDIKVRSAKSDANAIEMAYAKYIEGQGGE